MKKIAFISGSIRHNSKSVKILRSLQKLFPSNYQLIEVEIDTLPLYKDDYDNGYLATPESYLEFRQTIKDVEGIVIVTPEHNRSMPAALKNALDVGSRPFGANVWSRKVGLIISQSRGAMGGFGANHHLRQSLACLNVNLLQQPEVYLGKVDSLFNEADEIADTKTLEFLQNAVNSHLNLLEKLGSRKNISNKN